MGMIHRVIMAAVLVLLGAAFPAETAETREVVILYPKDHSVVYDKVNLVLDPADAPVFQAVVGTSHYPLVDTSTGKHAYQGLVLMPGINTITVKLFKSSDDSAGAARKLIATREITVFSRVELYAKGAIPAGFRQDYFHTRRQEEFCSGCHDLNPGKQAGSPRKPEDVICFGCHKEMPAGKNMHPPAADWDCLACHDPDLYPARYQFMWHDPWKVTQDIQSVQQLSTTVASSELFEPGTDKLLSGDKVVDVFKDVLSYAKEHPYDKVHLKVYLPENASSVNNQGMPIQHSGDVLRLEMHADDTLIRKETGAPAPLHNARAIAKGRAKRLAAFLLESGIREERLTASATESRLAEEARVVGTMAERGDRVEIVVNPREEPTHDGAPQPSPQVRERTMATIAYADGPEVKNLKVRLVVPKGRQYVKGSAAVGGTPWEPMAAGDELVWEIGNPGADFSKDLTYILMGSSTEPVAITMTYTADGKDRSRAVSPPPPASRVRTVEDVCTACHANVVEGAYRHGPTGSGYCNLCHNPHASTSSSLLRRSERLICLGCHGDKASGVHVIAAKDTTSTHPTQKRRDPRRQGKQLSCVSCHNPHAAASATLLVNNAKHRYELCGYCHQK